MDQVVNEPKQVVQFFVAELHSAPVFLVLIAVASMCLVLLSCGREMAWLACSIIGASTSVLLLWLSGSYVICFMVLFQFMVATGVVFLSAYFDEALNQEFWKMVLDAQAKAVQYSLVATGVGFGVLRFYSASSSESGDGFGSTAFYIIFSLTASMFVFFTWAILPTWMRLVETSRMEGSFKKNRRTQSLHRKKRLRSRH